MKNKLILIIMVGILLAMPMILAGELGTGDVGLTIDNIKSVDYNKMSLGYPEITIKNSFAWIIPLDPILDTKITSNTPKCPNGKCNLEQTFNNYYETASLEEDRFIDSKGHEIKDIPISHYTYKTETYIDRILDKIEKKCVEDTKSNNGSQICTYTPIYKDVQKERQIKVPYNLGDKMLGNNIIGTDADISSYDFVDYQMKSNGVWLSEYVGWTTANCFVGGNNLYIDGDYCVHTFTTNGTLNTTKLLNASILIIAGGGGGGGGFATGEGGGGGAGGLIYNNSYPINGNMTVLIGLGGNAGLQATNGTNGRNSSFGTLLAIGGGFGGSRNDGVQVGNNGGSGGGGGQKDTGISNKGLGITGQGMNGGDGFGSLDPSGAGGGGGAGHVGYDSTASNVGGNGGNGLNYSINGTNIYYAGGGGGASSSTMGTGGLGGGGNAGSNGINGTGSGGGAGSNGGTGIVIIRYLAISNIQMTAIQSYPINNYNGSSSIINIGCNFTAIEQNISSVKINVYNGGLSYTNTDTGNYGVSYNKTWTTTSLADGTYNWACYGYGNGGVNASTGNWTFTIDSTNPTISILTPTGNQGIKSIPYNVTLNYTASDTNLQNCWYNSSFNATQSFVVCNTTTIISVPNGNTNRIYVYANDSFGNSAVNWSDFYVEAISNPATFTSITYETTQETLSIPINSTGTISSAILNYNGTNYTSTLTNTGGNSYILSNTLTMNSPYGNKSFYWDFITGGNNYVTTRNNQTVKPIYFNLCNSSLNVPYINLTFKDEVTNLNINATIDTSSWDYWLGDGTLTKNLLFVNATSNPSYAFCFDPASKTIHNSRDVQYSFSGYPQRRYTETADLTNLTNNKVLYLLSNVNGLYVTFFTISSTGQAVSGVSVTATVSLGGVSTVVAQGITDASGGVTFWLNPNTDTVVSFSKTDCTPVTSNLRPTQSQYSQPMVCGGTSGGLGTQTVSRVEGIVYLRSPASGITTPGAQNFTFMVHADYNNANKLMLQIVDSSSSTVVAFSSVTCANNTNCQTSLVYTPVNGDDLKGRYYIDVGDGTGFILIEADAHWRFILTNVSDSGTVKDFMDNLKYMFNHAGEDSANCGAHQTNALCTADTNCKFIQDGSNNYCIPKDSINKLEYSKIVLLFLVMCIILAIANKLTGADANYPGVGFMLLGLMIIMGSITGGLHCGNGQCQGIFYYDGMFNITNSLDPTGIASGFLNNYILMICVLFLMVGWVLSVLRRNT